MVHVEIYTGIGEQKEGTIGARWQKGFIQEFDSYKFISKNYGVMKYHFKSIDPWLNGIFKSFCSEHDWRDDRNVWISDKYSVFSKCNEEYKEGIEQ